MSTAVATKLSMDDIVKQSTRNRTKVRQSPRTRTSISSNSFAKIMEDKETSPEQKADAVAKLLVNNDEALAEFNAYKEQLQLERKQDAQEIIDLTDTDAFGRLKDVIELMSNRLTDFEGDMEPLLEIVDSIAVLNMNGLTVDVMSEIIAERELYEKRKLDIDERQGVVDRFDNNLATISDENIALKNDKLFFFGPTRKSSQIQIEKNELRKQEITAKKEEAQIAIDALASLPAPDSQFDEFAHEKAVLRGVLDISGDEHRARQESLVNSANQFIITSDEQLTGVLSQFTGMKDQIKKLSDSNFDKSQKYAILNDAQDKATVQNLEKIGEIESREVGESDVQRLKKENQLRSANNFLEELRKSHVDTEQVSAELTGSRIRIDTMRKTNEAQVHDANRLQSSGVAGVADQLSTVLQAVAGAAIHEASQSAGMILQRMDNRTRDISKKEIIKNAKNLEGVSSELQVAIANLADYGEVVRAGSDMTRSTLETIKERTEDLRETVRETKESIQESGRVTADVVSQ